LAFFTGAAMGKTHESLKNIQEIRESKYSLALKKPLRKDGAAHGSEAQVSAYRPAPAAAASRSPLRNVLIPSAVVACVVLIFSLGIGFSNLYRAPEVKRTAPAKKAGIHKKKAGSVKQPSSRQLRPAAVKR
jgi:hypothetical protein